MKMKKNEKILTNLFIVFTLTKLTQIKVQNFVVYQKKSKSCFCKTICKLTFCFFLFLHYSSCCTHCFTHRIDPCFVKAMVSLSYSLSLTLSLSLSISFLLSLSLSQSLSLLLYLSYNSSFSPLFLFFLFFSLSSTFSFCCYLPSVLISLFSPLSFSLSSNCKFFCFFT